MRSIVPVLRPSNVVLVLGRVRVVVSATQSSPSASHRVAGLFANPAAYSYATDCGSRTNRHSHRNHRYNRSHRRIWLDRRCMPHIRTGTRMAGNTWMRIAVSSRPMCRYNHSCHRIDPQLQCIRPICTDIPRPCNYRVAYPSDRANIWPSIHPNCQCNPCAGHIRLTDSHRLRICSGIYSLSIEMICIRAPFHRCHPCSRRDHCSAV